jgi:hypothetical protein
LLGALGAAFFWACISYIAHFATRDERLDQF